MNGPVTSDPFSPDELLTSRWSQLRGTVLRQSDYGAGNRWLDVLLPKGARAPGPGQFMQLLVPAVKSAVLLPRPMSVAGARVTRQGLIVGFLYAPVGAGTFALAALAKGDTVDVLGPLGQGYPLEESGTPVLVAGGRGVAPLLFAADVLARAGRKSVFVFGARSREFLIGLGDARARLARMGGTLHLATDDGSRGMRGTVIDLLNAHAARLKAPLVIHSCGPHGMLKAVAHWAIARDARAHLAMESVMACGTGVCRGCPLPRSAGAREAFDPDVTPSLYGNREFAMCCTDGPVFEARELDWNRIE